jgi:hypothetical protein
MLAMSPLPMSAAAWLIITALPAASAPTLPDQLVRLVGVLDEVQDRGQDDRDRAAEVQRPRRLRQDRERLA